MMNGKSLLGCACGLFLSWATWAQVGINTPDPHPSSLLDLKADDKGFLLPRIGTAARQTMRLGSGSVAKAAFGLMVFDKEQHAFYYLDTVKGVSSWKGLHPWTTITDLKSSDVVLTYQGNVGIGQPSPAYKLDVGGTTRTSDLLVTNGLTVTGTLQANQVKASDLVIDGVLDANKIQGNGAVPSGAVLMWFGDVSNIPTGWALCNGAILSGFTTPDLRGRFIVGFDPSKSATPVEEMGKALNYGKVGNSGGLNDVLLTGPQSGLREHFHQSNQPFPNGKVDNESENSFVTNINYNVLSSGIKNVDNVINRNGVQTALETHENRPPYYVLAYIIKLP